AKYSGKIIGVDVDQKGIIDGQYGDGMTITSAMKGLAATVNTLLEAVKDGKWDQYKGQIQNLGLVSGTDMSQNYVGLAEDSTIWTDGFTDDNYKTLVGQLYDGTLKVSDDTTKSASDFATVIKVDDQGTLSGS
ncbi:MAG: BMP family ABC transporter substrate-binding protein, partial [Chordicoccus sp.]